jgi:hypothetical protein
MRKQKPSRIETDDNPFLEDESYLSVRGIKDALKEYLGFGDCKSFDLQLRKPCTINDYERCKNYKGKKIAICPTCPYRGNVR